MRGLSSSVAFLARRHGPCTRRCAAATSTWRLSHPAALAGAGRARRAEQQPGRRGSANPKPLRRRRARGARAAAAAAAAHRHVGGALRDVHLPLRRRQDAPAAAGRGGSSSKGNRRCNSVRRVRPRRACRRCCLRHSQRLRASSSHRPPLCTGHGAADCIDRGRAGALPGRGRRRDAAPDIHARAHSAL